MTKIHLTDEGPKTCTANKRTCPIGGDHFENMREAEKAFEVKMSNKHGKTATISKDGGAASTHSDDETQAWLTTARRSGFKLPKIPEQATQKDLDTLYKSEEYKRLMAVPDQSDNPRHVELKQGVAAGVSRMQESLPNAKFNDTESRIDGKSLKAAPDGWSAKKGRRG